MRHHSASQDELHWNGIDWLSGGYARQPATALEVAEELLGRSGSAEEVAALRRLAAGRPKGASELRSGADPQLLEEAGWGLILPAGAEPALLDALSPLLEWRRREAGELFRVFAGEEGLRPGESKARFLARHGAGGDPAPPALLPYYLLLAGSPAEIPFDFQAELDLGHAVGRVAFERIDDYASYAESVVAAEKGRSLRARLAAFFAPVHPGDPWSGFAERLLVRPLAEALPRRCADLEVRLLLGERAGKQALLELIGGSARPALLFAAAHGLSVPPAHPRAAAYQGALLAAGWPGQADGGPAAGEPVEPVEREHFLAAGDVRNDVDLRGLVAFLYASGSAGDPGGPSNEALLAALPGRMLCHPGGGALAVVAQLGGLRGYSFAWSGAGEITRAYGEALGRLVAGERIGAALQPLGELRRALAGRLADRLEEAAGGQLPDVHDLAGLAAAHDDARCHLLLGDPAIRLSWRDERAPPGPAAPEQRRRHLRRGRSAGRGKGQMPADAEPARLAADR